MKLPNFFRRQNYLYHGTSLENIPSIQTEGLDPKYFKRGIVFLSDSIGFASIWGNLEGLVRVNMKNLDEHLLTKSTYYNGEYQYNGIVSPEVLEFSKFSFK